MKNKKSKHSKENTKIKNVLLDILFVIFLVIIVISIYNIIEWKISSNQTSEIISEISKNIEVIEEEENTKYDIDFETLKSKNADTVAWLKVFGTTIEYPVVKGNNNDYYLSHSFDKTYNKSGWIFADYRNKFDGTDKNIIIYGHNMRDGKMFNSLKDIINPEWYENSDNHKVVFITEEGQFECQVFSVYQIDAIYYDTTVNFDSDEKFTNYINVAKSRSVYNFGEEISGNDRILTLSTCADNSKYRVILHAIVKRVGPF